MQKEAIAAILSGLQPDRRMDEIPSPTDAANVEIEGPTRYGNVFLRYDGLTVCISKSGYALISPGA